MEYRREIDGLRALAVVPVLLFHAGFKTLSGGFVGVDIFFVISGYLITSILLADLEQGRFSIGRFYERRARRILPALYLVMLVCLPFAYAWMMPDEFKNFGQSLSATALFSNNLLLSLTSGYWELASAFKPLLHTWSLGVEEQYYLLFPFVMLLILWFFGPFYLQHSRKGKLFAVLGFFMILSLMVSGQFIHKKPDLVFYILPTRAWEILSGALAAVFLFKKSCPVHRVVVNQYASLGGLALICLSIFLFDARYPSPGYDTLIPVLGTLLVILFAGPRTQAARFLGSPFMVSTGLMSYSLYLWHQPLLSFARVYCVTPPTPLFCAALLLLSVPLAYLSWRFVETPFRDGRRIKTKTFVILAVCFSLFFVSAGLYLNKSYGMPTRMDDPSLTSQDLDKRLYNERVFALKRDAFSSDPTLKLLVIGDSFGRDFVNMTRETFDTTRLEIIYRDDLSDCIYPYKSPLEERLFDSAQVIVFASGFQEACLAPDIAWATHRGKDIFYVGLKQFGYNLNWLIRLDPALRKNQYNPLLADTIKQEAYRTRTIPPAHFISLLGPITRNNAIPVTDEAGHILSMDRMHVTKYGAQFLGARALLPSLYGKTLLKYIQDQP